MKIKTWTPEMGDKETADLAYWERNCLALHFADGWYYDDVPIDWAPDAAEKAAKLVYGLISHRARFQGWRRVLSISRGRITFHIPDDFNVGDLPAIEPNWDGHTTEEKWRGILERRGIKP